MLIPLDICLNGSRDYVQGTQMIARAAEAVAAKTSGTSLNLRTATFHRISDRRVNLVVDPSKYPQNSMLGALTFLQDTTEKNVFLVEGDGAAPRLTIPVSATWSEHADMKQGALSTEFALGGLRNSEDLLIAIVQTIKGLHEALAEDVRDVWLTGFRSANVPMVPSLPVSEGQLSLQCRRTMKGDGNVWQTLLMASFSYPDAPSPIRSAVTFSFKSTELSHVD